VDKIECRQRRQEGTDTRVVADIGRTDVTLEITVDGRRSTHSLPRARIDAIVSTLRAVTVPPITEHPSGGEPVGYEITFTWGMTQSAFRWVAATPTGWSAIAAAADALLAIARDLAKPA
jgi:hypothetical protein